MNIRMAGIDHSLAGIDIRSQFSFSKSRQEEICRDLCDLPEVLGAVLIATCNRTEVYLSCEEGSQLHPFACLCQVSDIPFEDCSGLYKMRCGDEAFRHLCRLACGAESRIWGEDQIITQVKNAIVASRGVHCADGASEVLFRMAVTAAKRIKTELRFTKSEVSVAQKTLELFQAAPNPPHRVLVIGNGEVGRLVAKTLLAHGFEVTMTLRQYKYKQIDVPKGADALDYARRYEVLPQFDALVSATSSPHVTIQAELLAGLPKLPALYVDLAVPRDIDPSVAKLAGCSLYDIDTLSIDAITEDHEAVLRQADAIIEKYLGDFHKWELYRQAAVRKG